MAARCEWINHHVYPAPQCLQDKHYYRKHGKTLITGREINKIAKILTYAR